MATGHRSAEIRQARGNDRAQVTRPVYADLHRSSATPGLRGGSEEGRAPIAPILYLRRESRSGQSTQGTFPPGKSTAVRPGNRRGNQMRVSAESSYQSAGWAIARTGQFRRGVFLVCAGCNEMI